MSNSVIVPTAKQRFRGVNLTSKTGVRFVARVASKSELNRSKQRQNEVSDVSDITNLAEKGRENEKIYLSTPSLSTFPFFPSPSLPATPAKTTALALRPFKLPELSPLPFLRPEGLDSSGKAKTSQILTVESAEPEINTVDSALKLKE